MHWLIRKACESRRPDVVGCPTPEIIKWWEANATSNKLLFYTGYKVPTIKKYSNRTVVVLCYLWLPVTHARSKEMTVLQPCCSFPAQMTLPEKRSLRIDVSACG